jgi:type IX secretion system PorP/SprF family membrane protein
MRIIQQILLVSISFCAALTSSAQDIHFSQYYNSPLNLNPAMTGVMDCNIRLVGNYRSQWASVLRSNAFKTFAVSYDQKIPVGRYDYFSFGLGLWGDKAGAVSFATNQVKLSASYSKRMGGGRNSGHYLVVGAEGGVAQRSINFVAAQYGTQYDAATGTYDAGRPSNETFTRDNIVFGDFGAGLLWFSNFAEHTSVYGGLAMTHLNSPSVSFKDGATNSNEEVVIYPKFTFHAGGEVPLGEKMTLVPSFVSFFQGPNMEINPGASFKFLMNQNRRSYQAFQLGAWYRIGKHFDKPVTSDAIILATRFEYETFTLGLSYDINISPLRVASNGNGGFEFSLGYQICNNERRGVYCPTF